MRLDVQRLQHMAVCGEPAAHLELALQIDRQIGEESRLDLGHEGLMVAGLLDGGPQRQKVTAGSAEHLEAQKNRIRPCCAGQRAKEDESKSQQEQAQPNSARRHLTQAPAVLNSPPPPFLKCAGRDGRVAQRENTPFTLPGF